MYSTLVWWVLREILKAFDVSSFTLAREGARGILACGESQYILN